MTSREPGASGNALIDLIYQHLKENGYKKAASALKRHVPQVETTSADVSLDDIFKKWVSEEREKKNDEGKDPHRSSVPKPETARNAAHNTSSKKKVKSQTPAAARNQKRKRSETKTQSKRSSAVGSQTTEHSSTSPATGEDSDSDSSLDVEKWKRLAQQISDADIAKMDAFTNFSASTAKPTRKRKPAQPKKKQDQTIGNGKPSPKKTKVKSITKRTKTEKITTPLKPTAFSICESDKVKTPSKQAGIADPNVKSPETVIDQLATPQTGVSNGLSKSDKIKVKRKKTHSISESDNIETPSKKSESEKTDDVLEPTATGTPCKKTKSKKDVKVTKPGNLETPSRFTDPDGAIQKSQCALDSAELFESNSSKQSEGVLHSKTGETKAKKDKSKKVKIVAAIGIDTSIQTDNENEGGFLTSDQSKIYQVSDFIPTETPSKKAKAKKSKKSKEHQDSEDVTMPSGECQIKGDNSHSQPHHTEILSTSVTEDKSVEESESVAKQSKKAKKSSLEPNGAEKPSEKIETQAPTSILEPLSSETPSKKSKTKKGPETNQLDSPSKKNVADVVEGEATKSSPSKSDHNNNLPKKSKRKRTESSGENVTSSETEHASKSSECDHSGLDNSFIPAGNSIEESVLAVEEEGNPEPKKKKKKKKDKEKSNESDEIVEEVPPEEIADSLPSSQKKKKKKKQKHGDEEMPSVSTPAPEVDSPKKKKKSSKEKEHADVSKQGLI